MSKKYTQLAEAERYHVDMMKKQGEASAQSAQLAAQLDKMGSFQG